jgi:hypothetical protein
MFECMIVDDRTDTKQSATIIVIRFHAPLNIDLTLSLIHRDKSNLTFSGIVFLT